MKKNIRIFPQSKSKTILKIWGPKQFFTSFNFKFLFWKMFFKVKGSYYSIHICKIYKAPGIFWKLNFCRGCDQICRIFRIQLINIYRYIIGSIVYNAENHKVLNHSTLEYILCFVKYCLSNILYSKSKLLLWMHTVPMERKARIVLPGWVVLEPEDEPDGVSGLGGRGSVTGQLSHAPHQLAAACIAVVVQLTHLTGTVVPAAEGTTNGILVLSVHNILYQHLFIFRCKLNKC